MAFQQSTQVVQAPAQAGDFATSNPRQSTISVEGGYKAGAAGLTIGLFAWADTATGTLLSNTGTGVPVCFIHRELQGLITLYLTAAGYTIPAGMGVGSMFSGGDFWAKNAGAGAVTIGMKAFANTTNGTVSFAAPLATVAGSVETKWFAWTKGAANELIIISSTLPG